MITEILIQTILIQGILVHWILVKRILIQRILMQRILIQRILIQEILIQGILIQRILKQGILIQGISIKGILALLNIFNNIELLLNNSEIYYILWIDKEPFQQFGNSEKLLNRYQQNAAYTEIQILWKI